MPADLKPIRKSQQQRRAEAHGAMMNAAVKIMLDHGVEALTLAAVGETAGYSRGQPRHYYGNKESLMSEMVKYLRDQFGERLSLVQPEVEGLEALLGRVAYYYDLTAELDQDPEANGVGSIALQMALADALSAPASMSEMADLTKESIARFAASIRVGIERGEIHQDIDPQAEASVILATLRNTVSSWSMSPESLDLALVRDAHISNIVASLSAGSLET